MSKWISGAAFVALFLPLMTMLMDLFAYRSGVVRPLLIARDQPKAPTKTRLRFWKINEILSEYKFLKRSAYDPSAQAVAASIRRRIILIICLAVPTAVFLALNLFQ